MTATESGWPPASSTLDTLAATEQRPSSPSAINVSAVIDTSRLSALQWRVFVLCLLCLVIDGFDVQALGYTAPAIVDEWKVANAVLGPVFAEGNFGVLIGSLAFSMAADRIGRRPVIIGATFFFAVTSFLTGRASSVDELLVYRFLAGLGLGSIMPQAASLVGEYSPTRSRTTLIMAITVGFTAGAAIGGFIAAALIPLLGWRAVFYLGGIVPFVIAVVMLFALPESLQFMVLWKKNHTALARWLRQIDPSLVIDRATVFEVSERRQPGAPVAQLFAEGRGFVTILLWIVNFMNLLNLYSLASWLPTLVREGGYTTQTAVLVGTVLQVGGTVGTFGLAWLVGRWRFVPTLVITFAIGGASILLIGFPNLSLQLLVLVVFVAGWCTVGSQPGLNALAANYYPIYVRSTGVGAALGIGRIGAIVGPLILGILLGRHWSMREMFIVAAVPAFVAALVMAALQWSVDEHGKPQAAKLPE